MHNNSSQQVFATMLTRFTRKIFVVLSHTFLEWILIISLLFNSFFAYMIKKFAFYFNLTQPCILCSRVDHLHLLDPTDSYKSLVCENHATEISNLRYCSSHHRLVNSQQMCEECYMSNQTQSNEKILTCSCCQKVASKRLHFPLRESLVIREIKEEKTEEIGCKLIEVGNHCGFECKPPNPPILGSFYLRESAEDSNKKHEMDDRQGGKEGQTLSKEEANDCVEGNNSIVDSSSLQKSDVDGKMEGNDGTLIAIKQVKSDFDAEQKARNELYAELEAERNAAAIAANQTMAMITRLQEEKAAMQMEALQYQRVMEEQAQYDQEALQLLKELLSKRETEKEHLQKELNVYRQRVLDYEAIQKCPENNNNLSSSCSIDNDSDHSKRNHPNTIASVARKLLDLVESDDNDQTEDVETTKEVDGTTTTTTTTTTELGIAPEETDSKRVAVEKEMDHVYGRLQALEADTEFLRHCIGSVNKGNEGLGMLQEILQHLRALRDAEICF
ncbi:putative myosin-binding protein 6 [Bienertia sinuspersici]